MSHSKDIKVHVRELRRSGLSLNQIVSKTGIPKTTIRGWISDINLSLEQQKVLIENRMALLQKGRIKAQRLRKEQRVTKEKLLLGKGRQALGKLSQRELFLVGVALYWAEGFKNRHEHRLGFCNSDPYMVRFYIKWLHTALEVEKKDITARLTLNASYKERTKDIEQYWVKTTGIPLRQFTKPFYQNTQWKKQYKNNNYYGVLRIHVRGSLDHLLTMRGWIEGLYLNLENQ